MRLLVGRVAVVVVQASGHRPHPGRRAYIARRTCVLRLVRGEWHHAHIGCGHGPRRTLGADATRRERARFFRRSHCLPSPCAEGACACFRRSRDGRPKTLFHGRNPPCQTRVGGPDSSVHPALARTRITQHARAKLKLKAIQHSDTHPDPRSAHFEVLYVRRRHKQIHHQ